MKKSNILIIGQGLAGTVLADKLMQKNHNVTMIDKGHQGVSSAVAAGVINPVTGRRIVKSWMIDELQPVAKAYYLQVEEKLKIKLWHELPSLRIFTDTAMSNNWSVRMEHEGYQEYLDFASAKELLNYPIQQEFGVGIIHHSARANIGLMISSFREKWKREGYLVESEFQYQELSIANEEAIYQNKRYDKIIFCQGWEGAQNPLFSDLPFQVSKGEVLILRIPKIPEEKIIKRKVAFVPLGDHLFWVGATNFWTFENSAPSSMGMDWLLAEVRAVLSEKSSFEIVEHIAAIRPTVRNRRPLIGFPENITINLLRPTIGIFNGFGTKGTSLVPYWADQFIEHLDEVGWLLENKTKQKQNDKFK